MREASDGTLPTVARERETMKSMIRGHAGAAALIASFETKQESLQ